MYSKRESDTNTINKWLVTEQDQLRRKEDINTTCQSVFMEVDLNEGSEK
jgi:hypothetical protein